MLTRILLVSGLLAAPSFAATVLGVSDIMFVGYSAEGATEDFSFVTFVELDSTTSIRFSDRPWTGTAFDTTNSVADGEIVWSSSSTISAGSVVTININMTSFVASASTGSVTGNFGTTGLSTAGEIIFAYQGTAGIPQFVHAVNYRKLYDTPSAGDTLDSFLPAALNVTNGNLIINSTTDDNAEFQSRGTQTSLANYKALISNPANWTVTDDEITLSTTSFTTIPEPSSVLGLVVGSVMLLNRRRR